VHVTELGRDYFHYDAGRHALIGERSGRVFQLAGRLRVKLVRVDLESAKIEFALAADRGDRTAGAVSEPSRSGPPARGKRRS
jgi:ribonuclease R